LIALAGGRRLFLKQDPAERSTLLEREAAVLAALSEGGLELAPRLIHFDSEQRLLITESMDGYVPLDRGLRSRLLAEPAAATASALALARLHEHAPEIRGGVRPSLPFPLAASAPLTPEDIAALPEGYAQFAVALRQSRDAVDQLASRWRPGRFIHGDFKVDNLLFRMEPRLKRQPPIVIVDWEMAGDGDPLWDIGSFIGSVLLAWMQVLAPSAASAEALVSRDANQIRRQIGYFLLTYRHMAPGIFDAAGSFAVMALQYAGIFMLHRVAVGLEIAGQLDAGASLLLAFGGSLLNHPERAAEALLGGVAL
jgi:hypothetical protein